MSEILDAVVIGAGLSGLTAARTLVRGGAKVEVLEAKPRVGGRTLTAVIGNGTFDLGGQWLGPGQERLAALTRELGVPTFPTYHQGTKVLDLGGKLSTYRGDIPSISPLGLLDLQKALWVLAAVGRRVPLEAPWNAARARAWDATTLESYKRRILWHKGVRELFDVAVQVIFGAEPAEISLLHFLFYTRAAGGFMRLVEIENGAQKTRFATGAQSLSLALAKQLGERVHVDAPVTSVRHDAGGATIESAAGTRRAKRVIFALPPALIGKIALEPHLPAARDVLARTVPMGATTKVICTYERAFWRERGYSGEVVSTGGPIAVVFDNVSHDGRQPALLAFVVGERARTHARRTADERRRLVLAQLARWFGAEAASPTEVVEHDWAAEPYSFGCPVGVAMPGALTQAGAALREPVGCLHFAGTETATQWNGYLDGAIQAGERAAREVLERL
jgi:monoamine oxidase